MTEDKECAGLVRVGNYARGCEFAGKYHENGDWWCGVHAPSKKATREDMAKDMVRLKEHMRRLDHADG